MVNWRGTEGTKVMGAEGQLRVVAGTDKESRRREQAGGQADSKRRGAKVLAERCEVRIVQPLVRWDRGQRFVGGEHSQKETGLSPCQGHRSREIGRRRGK